MNKIRYPPEVLQDEELDSLMPKIARLAAEAAVVKEAALYAPLYDETVKELIYGYYYFPKFIMQKTKHKAYCIVTFHNETPYEKEAIVAYQAEKAAEEAAIEAEEAVEAAKEAELVKKLVEEAARYSHFLKLNDAELELIYFYYRHYDYFQYVRNTEKYRANCIINYCEENPETRSIIIAEALAEKEVIAARMADVLEDKTFTENMAAVKIDAARNATFAEVARVAALDAARVGARKIAAAAREKAIREAEREASTAREADVFDMFSNIVNYSGVV